MNQRSSQQRHTRNTAANTGNSARGGTRLFGQETPGMSGSGQDKFGRFGDSWMSRLLIGGALLLLVVMFPLQWLRTPTLAVRSNLSTFSPLPGAAAGDAGAGKGAVTASYDLSEEATVSAAVLSEAGTVVKNLSDSKRESAGQHFVSWDGTNSSGGLVPDGAYRLQITAAGPARSSNGSVTVAVDTVPPKLQLVNLNDGAKLKNADLIVQGLTEPGATVQFEDSPDVIAADGSGGFTLRRQLQSGDNSFTVLARDPSGNEARATRTLALLDKPPAIAIESPADGVWTNQKLVTVSGTVDPGSSVVVNGQEAAPAADGRFRIDIVLEEGNNALVIEATDAVGNKSRLEQRANLDTRPPAISIDSLSDGSTVHDAQVHVYGKTDTGARLTVQQAPVVVDSQGRFDHPVDLVVGDNSIHVEAQDQAGNIATLDRKVRYDLNSSSLPDLPITGTAIAIALIVLLWVIFGGMFSSVSLRLATDKPAFSPASGSERVVVTYSLSKSARATVQVVDGRGNLINTLLRGASRSAGDHQVIWDGSTAQGELAPPGNYTIQAQARTLTSAVSSSAGVQIEGGFGFTRRAALNAYDRYNPDRRPPGAPTRTYGYDNSSSDRPATEEDWTPPTRNVNRRG